MVFTIYPWREPIAPSRIWCLFEAMTASDLGVELQFQLDSDFKNQSQPLKQLEQGLLKSLVSDLDVGRAQVERAGQVGVIPKK